MKIVFLDQANREFSDAVQYYDGQEPGLGQRFEDEIERAIHWLSTNPEACALRRGIYRRMNLRVFRIIFPTLSANRLCGWWPLLNRSGVRNTGSGERKD